MHESASFLVTGTIYLWGKASYVKPVTIQQPIMFEPIALDLPDHHVQHVSCGSWHVAAVTGLPTDSKSILSLKLATS